MSIFETFDRTFDEVEVEAEEERNGGRGGGVGTVKRISMFSFEPSAMKFSENNIIFLIMTLIFTMQHF